MRMLLVSALMLSALGCAQPSASVETVATTTHGERVAICNRQFANKENNPDYDRCIERAYAAN